MLYIKKEGYVMEKNRENLETQDEMERCEPKELELEIIELEDKIAPRNWNVYAVM